MIRERALTFFLCVALLPGAAACPPGHACQAAAASLLQVKERSALATSSHEAAATKAADSWAELYSPQDTACAVVFLLVISFGSILSQGSQQLGSSKSSVQEPSATRARDSIEGTRSQRETDFGLAQNTGLLKHEPPPAAKSLLELLPKSKATALCRDGIDSEPVSYAELHEMLEDAALHPHFSQGERVALVLENGKEMALCLLAVMHTACAVPLNPTFTQEELAVSMEQLRCTAAVVQAGHAGDAARQAASRLGLRAFTLGKAGKLLWLDGPAEAPEAECAREDAPRDVLVLKTSGTTSKGKVVTFDLQRLSLAAKYNARCMQLGGESVCLSMMPLYHIAGISVNFLASLSAGATVRFYTGAFDAKRFVAELERPDSLRPTWYFAVPAVHEAVLSQAAELGRPLSHRLTAIRSAGAALVQQTGLRLVDAFNCAVMPAYGMTEALEITCPPLDYALQRPGSVGPSISAEVKIVDGEVCVRGDLVMPGYEFHGPEAEDPNREAWTGGSRGEGFLRTGDLGHMDNEGWVFLTGRCKEMINRGGETINPHEVEPTIVSKPEIEAAVCFAAPHFALGECVAAAVVLKKGFSPEEVSPEDILRHCAARASKTMQPEAFVYLQRSALPTTATKKFIRAGLAQRLGLDEKLMSMGPTAFLYDETTRTLKPRSFEQLSGTIKDSLGQLRGASAQQLAEQRLKEGLLGLGVFQVVTKHWLEGNYSPETFSLLLRPWERLVSSNLLFMSLFFLLSGHTASQLTGRGALCHRWLGFYTMATLASIIALSTNSLHVDWYFAWLLIVEVLTIGLNFLLSMLPVEGGMRVFAATATILGFLMLGAWFREYPQWDSHSGPFWKFVVHHHWGAHWRIVDSRVNMLLANVDLAMGNWHGGQLCVWGAAYATGFHMLPRLSRAAWAQPKLLHAASLRAARLGSVVLIALLISCHPEWPTSTDGWWWPGHPRGSNEFEPLIEFLACASCLCHSLVTVGFAAVAIGSQAHLFQEMGRCSIGALVTHTAFSKWKSPGYWYIQSKWPFHTVLQFEVLAGRADLLLCAMVVVPVLYVLSVGKWAQKIVDILLQHPFLGFPMWAFFLIVYSYIADPPPDLKHYWFKQ